MIVAHTPDVDDAFMFYAMTVGKIPTRLKIEHFIEDIETLNKMAFECMLDVTALSVHAYAYLSDKYKILSSGSSVGDGYGPIVVSRGNIDLEGKSIAIPGRFTTANLILKLALDKFKPVEMRFDEILDAVRRGVVDAGLVIHEGQITFESYGLVKVLDLWEFWNDLTGLPLPLGVNVIRRHIPREDQREFLRVMRESVVYALENVDEALDYAMRYSRVERDVARRFALMYVNEYTVEMPPKVLRAIEKLFEIAEERGILKKPKLDVLF